MLKSKRLHAQAERVDSQRVEPEDQFHAVVKVSFWAGTHEHPSQVIFFPKTLLHWSSHYWSVVADVVLDKSKFASKRLQLLPSTMDLNSLLAEAQFALGKEAIYNSDTTLALEHFSQVNTPQAAWNQVQVCVIICNMEPAPQAAWNQVQMCV